MPRRPRKQNLKLLKRSPKPTGKSRIIYRQLGTYRPATQVEQLFGWSRIFVPLKIWRKK